jgi:hypothetical protein
MRHGVNESRLRRLNALNADFVLHGWVGRTLLLPVAARLREARATPEPERVGTGKEQLVAALRAAAEGDLTEAEARVYLEDAGWALPKAVVAQRGDAAWESRERRKRAHARRGKNVAPGRAADYLDRERGREGKADGCTVS